MKVLNQQEDAISAWPLPKLFMYARVAAEFDGRKFI
jgi:hypothetical protein